MMPTPNVGLITFRHLRSELKLNKRLIRQPFRNAFHSSLVLNSHQSRFPQLTSHVYIREIRRYSHTDLKVETALGDVKAKSLNDNEYVTQLDAGNIKIGIRLDNPKKKSAAETKCEAFIRMQGEMSTEMYPLLGKLPITPSRAPSHEVEKTSHERERDEKQEHQAKPPIERLMASSWKLITWPFHSHERKSEDDPNKDTIAERNFWIPTQGSFKFKSFTPSEEQKDKEPWTELSFAFNKATTKGAEILADPHVDTNSKIAFAVRLLVKKFTKIPFAGKITSDIAEKLTRKVLNQLAPEKSRDHRKDDEKDDDDDDKHDDKPKAKAKAKPRRKTNSKKKSDEDDD